MKKTLVPVVAALLLCCNSYLSHAQETNLTVPRQVSYQGFVTDPGNNPLNGLHSIAIKLYDASAGGNILHSESFSVPLTNGIFSVLLGSNQPLESSVTFDKQYWLGVSIDGGAELSPRTAFTSAPYALRASEANALSKNAAGAVRSINAASGDIVLKAGNGADIEANGNTFTISVIPTIGVQPQSNVSIVGTANQVLANGTSGVVQSGQTTLTLPQNIHAGASPQFTGLTLSGMGSGIVHSGNSGILSSSLIDNTDVSASAAIAYSKLNLSGSIQNSDINASAAISDSKLSTISSVGKVANSATTGTATSSPNTLVLRDASGNFSAGTISASSITLSGKASAAATTSSDPSSCLATKGYVDNSTSTAWSINGNSGLSSSNYVGTNDATDLQLATSGLTRMKLTSDGSLLLSGTSGAVPASGFGTRMMWIPSLGAFRAGKANNNEWNSGNIGAQSVAMGYGVLASGSQSVSMGFFSSASGLGSVALGVGAASYADGATALGEGSQAVGFNSVAMGDNSTAWSDDAVAIGSNTSATGFASVTLGYNTTTTDNYSMATGKNLTVGVSSFGFNGSTTNATANLSGMGNIADLGDVDLIIGNDDNSARSLRFYAKNSSPTLSGAFYSSFKAGNQTANITYTLPTSQGTANSLLINNGTGSLSWSSLTTLHIPTGSGATNTIAMWNGSSTLSNASNLYYNPVTNNLGIGTATPAQALDVNGNVNVSGTMNSGGISMTGGTAVLAYATVAAGASISVPSSVVVKITDDGTSDLNALTMPLSGTNGQIMYIYNADADPTSGDAIIASGATATFVYADGWRKAN